MAEETSIHVNCFMAWEATPCTILSETHTVGLVKLPQPGGVSLI